MAVKFDPTINLGHVLTFASMVAAVMASYSLLDKQIGRASCRERVSSPV